MNWLIFILLTTIPVMIFGIEDVFGNRISGLLLVIYTIFPIILVGFSGVGFTGKNIRTSILIGIAVGIAYGIIRGLFLKFIPESRAILGADLAILEPRLRTGIQIGPVLVKGFWMLLLGVVLFPLFIGIETYFRGFLFLSLKKYIPWPWAIATVSTVQAIARRTPHSLVMESIAGLLMQKYNNIWAPIFFHGFQFFTALFIVMYL